MFDIQVFYEIYLFLKNKLLYVVALFTGVLKTFEFVCGRNYDSGKHYVGKKKALSFGDCSGHGSDLLAANNRSSVSLFTLAC